MKKINFEEQFNLLLDHVLMLYSLEETCARLAFNGLDDEQLEYIGFERETIAASKDILKRWEA